jgi:hypothetical protein
MHVSSTPPTELAGWLFQLATGPDLGPQLATDDQVRVTACQVPGERCPWPGSFRVLVQNPAGFEPRGWTWPGLWGFSQVIFLVRSKPLQVSLDLLLVFCLVGFFNCRLHHLRRLRTACRLHRALRDPRPCCTRPPSAHLLLTSPTKDLQVFPRRETTQQGPSWFFVSMTIF